MPDFKSRFNGTQIDEAVTLALGLNITSNGWLKIPSSEEYPINLDLLINVGNFTIGYFINGSSYMMTTKPLNISVVSINNVIYQYSLIKDNIENRKYENDVWTAWATSKSSSYIYQQDTEPVGVDIDSLWIDTHLPAGPYPIKVLKENGWTELVPSNMMDKNIYDVNGTATDLYTAVQNYIEAFKTANNLGTLAGSLNTHIEDMARHTTTAEKNTWNAKETPTSAQNKVDAALVEAKSYTDNQIAGAVSEAGSLENDLMTVQTSLTTHSTDTTKHVTSAERNTWNGKADGTHTHIKDGRVKIDASDVVSGVFAIERIPKGALERIVEVANNAARLALTAESVQTGDSVYVTDAKEFYFVIDDTKLNLEAGYQLYSSGVASSVLWSNIKNKPTTISGYGITDAYNKTEVDGLIESMTTTLETYTDDKIEEYDSFIQSNANKITLNIFDSDYNYITGISYGNSIYVLLVEGDIYTSSDLITFTKQTLPISVSLTEIIYANGLFIAVGVVGVILTSPDGTIWTQQISGVTQNIQNIKYINNLFIALGSIENTNGMILTSPDGITWTRIPNIYSANLYNIVYVNNKYLAVGDMWNIAISSDTIEWSFANIPSINGQVNLFDVIYGNNLFIVIGEEYKDDVEGSNAVLYTSNDGEIWNQQISLPNSGFNNIIYCDNRFIAVGYDYSNNLPFIYISNDGIIWNQLVNLTFNIYVKMVYVNNAIFIMGENKFLASFLITKSTFSKTIENINQSIIPLNSNINELYFNSNGQKNIDLMQEAFTIASINQQRLINAETNVLNLTEKMNESIAIIDRLAILVG